jgi:hypothetical protein
MSPVFYGAAIALANVSPTASYGLYVLVALLWVIPDKRLVAVLEASDNGRAGH